MERPEFTAEELNILSELARDKGEPNKFYVIAHYQRTKDFVMRTLEYEAKDLSEKQLKWLWGIKKELKDMAEGE